MSDPALHPSSLDDQLNDAGRLPADRVLLLRVDDVCELLSLSRSTVNRLITNGTIPSVAVGRTRRVARAQLERFVALLATGEVTVEPRRPGRKASS